MNKIWVKEILQISFQLLATQEGDQIVPDWWCHPQWQHFRVLFNFPSRYLWDMFLFIILIWKRVSSKLFSTFPHAICSISIVTLSMSKFLMSIFIWKEFLQSSFQLSLMIFVNFLHVEVHYISIHLKRLPSELFSTFPHDTCKIQILEFENLVSVIFHLHL